MNMKFIDQEEKELFEEFESGNMISTADLDAEKQEWKEYAINTLAKSKSINVRLQERDLRRLKVVAARKGLPYQTMISSLLHQYVVKVY